MNTNNNKCDRDELILKICNQMSIKRFINASILMTEDEKHKYKFKPMDIVKLTIRHYNEYVNEIGKLNCNTKYGLVCGYIRYKNMDKIPVSFTSFIPTIRRLLENDDEFKKNPRSIPYFKADDDIKNLMVFLLSLNRMKLILNNKHRVNDVINIKMVKLCDIGYSLYDSDEETENELEREFGGENFKVNKTFHDWHVIIKIKPSIIKKIETLGKQQEGYDIF